MTGGGSGFLHLMKKIEVELQRLTTYIHGYIMVSNYTISGINGHLWQIDITQWESTKIQFVHLFLFLFDVDITLERGTDYEYLEVCAWKVSFDIIGIRFPVLRFCAWNSESVSCPLPENKYRKRQVSRALPENKYRKRQVGDGDKS
jgi:hypothetical protein